MPQRSVSQFWLQESFAKQQQANDQRDFELGHGAHSGPPFCRRKTMWQRRDSLMKNTLLTSQDPASNSSTPSGH
jgi:hypothetical protein